MRGQDNFICRTYVLLATCSSRRFTLPSGTLAHGPNQIIIRERNHIRTIHWIVRQLARLRIHPET